MSRNVFRHAATAHDPLYGAAAFTLQSLGNVLIMALLFILLSYGPGGRPQRRLAARPGRAAALTASVFPVTGFFTLVHRTLRMLGRLDYIWFPAAPWSS